MTMNLASLPTITGFYTALMLLMLLSLAGNVVRWRLNAKVSLGDGGHRDLTAAIRAHGNAAEYVPMVLLAMALLEMLGASATVMHLYGATFFVARVLHPLGMTAPKKVNKSRQLGIALSWLVMIALAVHLLARALF
ncbi:MAG: MAPEG family protein [Alcanivoracaceae bacterium]